MMSFLFPYIEYECLNEHESLEVCVILKTKIEGDEYQQLDDGLPEMLELNQHDGLAFLFSSYDNYQEQFLMSEEDEALDARQEFQKQLERWLINIHARFPIELVAIDVHETFAEPWHKWSATHLYNTMSEIIVHDDVWEEFVPWMIFGVADTLLDRDNRAHLGSKEKQVLCQLLSRSIKTSVGYGNGYQAEMTFERLHTLAMTYKPAKREEFVSQLCPTQQIEFYASTKAGTAMLKRHPDGAKHITSLLAMIDKGHALGAPLHAIATKSQSQQLLYWELCVEYGDAPLDAVIAVLDLYVQDSQVFRAKDLVIQFLNRPIQAPAFSRLLFWTAAPQMEIPVASENRRLLAVYCAEHACENPALWVSVEIFTNTLAILREQPDKLLPVIEHYRSSDEVVMIASLYANMLDTYNMALLANPTVSSLADEVGQLLETKPEYFSVIDGPGQAPTGMTSKMLAMLAHHYTIATQYTQATYWYDQAITNLKKEEEAGTLPHYELMHWLGFCHHQRATITNSKSDYDDAIGFYSRAINENATLGVTQINLGNLYIELDRNEEAAKEFTQAIQQSPTDPLILANSAAAHHRLGEFHRAVELASEAILLRPRLYIAYNHRAMANLALKKYALVHQDLVMSESINSTHAAVHFIRGTLGLAHHCADDAKLAFARGVEIDPDYEITYRHESWPKIAQQVLCIPSKPAVSS